MLFSSATLANCKAAFDAIICLSALLLCWSLLLNRLSAIAAATAERDAAAAKAALRTRYAQLTATSQSKGETNG